MRKKAEIQFTADDIKLYFHLHKSFGNFLKYIGEDHTSIVVKALLEPRVRFVFVDDNDRKIVEAFAAWQYYFHLNITMLWLGKKRDWAKNALHNIMELRVPELATRDHYRYTQLHAINENGSRIIATYMNEHAARGMTITHMIIDGTAPDDKKWDDIFNVSIPAFAARNGNKYITIS